MTDQDIKLYNIDVERRREKGSCRLDAERDAWWAWLAGETQAANRLDNPTIEPT